MFLFKDPKEERHFYDYINTKFNLNDHLVDTDVPFTIRQEHYFFSFYEVEIQDKSLNFFPVFFDVMFNLALGNQDDMEPIVSTADNTLLKDGNWYIAIEVYSDSEKDCLGKNSFSRDVVLEYLRRLKKEYLSSHNYNEVVFKN